MRVERSNNGFPERPPVSVRAAPRSEAGRVIVVFETINPSILFARAVAMMESSSLNVRSGAIFKSTGLRP